MPFRRPFMSELLWAERLQAQNSEVDNLVSSAVRDARRRRAELEPDAARSAADDNHADAVPEHRSAGPQKGA